MRTPSRRQFLQAVAGVFGGGMTLTVRSATVSGATKKGSSLTHAEMDENWNHVANFTQSGSGASTRTILAKLREVVISVMDFGATGDGSTNDATAIQAAVDAAAGRIVWFPAGTYKVNSSIELNVQSGTGT